MREARNLKAAYPPRTTMLRERNATAGGQSTPTRGTWATENAGGAQLGCSGQLVPDIGGHRQVVAQLEKQDNGRRLWSMSEANQVRTVGVAEVRYAHAGKRANANGRRGICYR